MGPILQMESCDAEDVIGFKPRPAWAPTGGHSGCAPQWCCGRQGAPGRPVHTARVTCARRPLACPGPTGPSRSPVTWPPPLQACGFLVSPRCLVKQVGFWVPDSGFCLFNKKLPTPRAGRAPPLGCHKGSQPRVLSNWSAQACLELRGGTAAQVCGLSSRGRCQNGFCSLTSCNKDV